MIHQSMKMRTNFLNSKLVFTGAYPTYEEFLEQMRKYNDNLEEFTKVRYQLLYDELGSMTFLITNDINKLNAFLYRNWTAGANIAKRRQQLYNKNLEELLEKQTRMDTKHFDVGESEVSEDFLTGRSEATAKGRNQLVNNIEYYLKLLEDPENDFIDFIKSKIVATVQPTRKIIIKGVPYYE